MPGARPARSTNTLLLATVSMYGFSSSQSSHQGQGTKRRREIQRAHSPMPTIPINSSSTTRNNVFMPTPRFSSLFLDFKVASTDATRNPHPAISLLPAHKEAIPHLAHHIGGQLNCSLMDSLTSGFEIIRRKPRPHALSSQRQPIHCMRSLTSWPGSI